MAAPGQLVDQDADRGRFRLCVHLDPCGREGQRSLAFAIYPLIWYDRFTVQAGTPMTVKSDSFAQALPSWWGFFVAQFMQNM